MESRDIDFKDVAGNEIAKRALQIAVAGGHGILIMGPDNAPKAELAERIPTIMAGGSHPFVRATGADTLRELVADGNPFAPGKAAAADGGVLFLDGLEGFGNAALSHLRAAHDEGKITLVNVRGTASFASRFLLVAACAPCRCGHYGSVGGDCRCSPHALLDYRRRVGGNLAGAFDMLVHARAADARETLSDLSGASSADLAEGVRAAREFAARRGGAPIAATVCAALDACQLSEDDLFVFRNAAHALGLCERQIASVLRVARTIADISQSERVGFGHITEALAFRFLLD